MSTIIEKNKKVGIITFHSAINYGAALQAMALYNALEKLNIASEIIDYRNEIIEEQYGIQTKFSSNNIIVKGLLFLVKNFNFYQKKIKFRKFMNNNTKITDKKYYYKNIQEIESLYNIVIAGSDQVWNLKLTGNDTRYFLDFLPKEKKRSYAASFGVKELEKKDIQQYKKMLNDFPYISVREDTGKKICEDIGVMGEVRVDLDPTLLFDGIEWSKYCKKIKKKKYILLYKVALPEKLVEFIKKFAIENNLDVIEIGSELRKSAKEFKMVRNGGPEEFLTLIRNADYVATTSFHATVFSILFHKNMILELEDATGKYNVRIDNLLKLAGIDNTGEKILQINKCDWKLVDENLKKQRKISLKYLKEIREESK